MEGKDKMRYMKKTLKCLICGALVTGLSFSLLSLSSNLTVALASQKEEITITYWTFDRLYIKVLEDGLPEWLKRYPQYKINLDFMTHPGANEMYTKMLTTLATSKGTPDFIDIEISWFSRFMKHDIAEQFLVDLTPLIGEEREKYLRWQPYMYKGKIYGVETALCPVVYYYREDIFREVGVETPIETWKDFVIAGRKLKAGGHFAAAVPTKYIGSFMMLFQQQGGNFFDKEGNFALAGPKAVEVLKFLVDGANKEKILWDTTDYYGPAHAAALKQDKVVGDIGPDWWSVYYLQEWVPEQAGKWRIQLLPAWTPGGRRSSTLGGSGLAITKQAKHPKLIFDLIHYAFMDKENQIRNFEMIQYFPTMIEAINDPRVRNFSDPYYGEQKIGAVFAESGLNIPIQWQSPYWEEAFQILVDDGLTSAMAGKKTPKQAIEDVVAEVKRLMGE